MNSSVPTTGKLPGTQGDTTVSGRVVAGQDGRLFVEVPRRSACQSCAKESACGMSVLGGLSASQSLRLALNTGEHAPEHTPGETVVLSCSHDGLLKAALIAYAPPSLGVVLGAVVAALNGLGDGAQAAAAVLGLGLGLIFTRVAAARGALPAMHILKGVNR